MNIPKNLKHARFSLLLVPRLSLKKTRHRAGYYSFFSTLGTKKSTRLKTSMSKVLGYKLLIALLLMMSFCISYAQIYKWVDDQGNVHFSDTTHPGAQTLTFPNIQSYSSPRPQASLTLTEPSASVKKPHHYTNLAITQPEDQATIRKERPITVAVHLEPALYSGDKLQMVFDKVALGAPQTTPLFQLSGVYRGSHSIQVQIIDAQETVLKTSDPITIYVFKQRIAVPSTKPRKI